MNLNQTPSVPRLPGPTSVETETIPHILYTHPHRAPQAHYILAVSRKMWCPSFYGGPAQKAGGREFLP